MRREYNSLIICYTWRLHTVITESAANKAKKKKLDKNFLCQYKSFKQALGFQKNKSACEKSALHEIIVEVAMGDQFQSQWFCECQSIRVTPVLLVLLTVVPEMLIKGAVLGT